MCAHVEPVLLRALAEGSDARGGGLYFLIFNKFFFSVTFFANKLVFQYNEENHFILFVDCLWLAYGVTAN